MPFQNPQAASPPPSICTFSLSFPWKAQTSWKGFFFLPLFRLSLFYLFFSICRCKKLHAPLFPGRRAAFLWNLTLLNALETAANISRQLVYDQLANVPKLSLIFCECFDVKQTATRVQKHCRCLCRYTLEELVLPRIRVGPGTNWSVTRRRTKRMT